MNRLSVGAGLGLAIGAVISLLLWFNLFAEWQQRSTDFLYIKRAGAAASGWVVIVAVDDRSLEELGRWEDWPRRRHARLIEALHQAGARVIGLDIIFCEPSPDDEILAEAIVRAGNVVQPVLGFISVPRRVRRGELSTFERFLKPQPMLAEVSALGHINVFPDWDGVIRCLSALIISEKDGEEAPAFALAVVARFLRLPVVDYRPRNGCILLADRRIPVDDFGRMFVNYLGPPSQPGRESTFRVYSYVDVLKGRVDPAAFQGKIVLVGMIASAMADNHPTPISGETMFGVEIHANVIETILGRHFLREQSLLGQMALVLGLAVIGGIVFSWLHPSWAGGALVFLLGLYWLAASIAFEQGLILNFLYPSLTLPLVYIVAIIYRYFTGEHQRRYIIGLFGRYVSPEVVEAVLASFDAGALRLGGTSREATVLFADMRDFTDLAENLPPAEVMETLNVYLAAMVKVVDKYEGTVNKFIGDSIMAIWNAPLNQPDHALRAVHAAIEMQQAIKEIRTSQAGIAALEFGIGINSGEMVAGNVGSERRMEYTVIGDAVNLAHGLCNLASEGEILLGPRTYELLRGKMAIEERPAIWVKGRKEPLTAYAVKKNALLAVGKGDLIMCL